jgi:hypothetical protein
MALPRILNNAPLVTPVPLDDPYYPYYFTGTSMGTFVHDDQLIFKFIGYNPNATGDQDPYTYDLGYTISTPTPVSPKPAFSVIEPSTGGWLNGTLSNIGADIVAYSIVVRVYLLSDPTVYFEDIFTFVLNGTIDATITWLTPSNLGTINNGAISDIFVSAQFSQDVTDGMYELVAGSLPPGLEVLSDGGIAGRVEFQLQNYGTYTFTIRAYSKQYPTLITSTREFTLEVEYVAPPDTPYDTIYMKGLLSLVDREKVDSLLTYISAEQEVIRTNIYRPTDDYFGVARDIRYQHQYGIKSVSTTAPGNPEYLYTEYYAALQRNFYWKNLTLGTLQTAVAKDTNGNIIYEVVYSEIIDNLVNADGVSISKEVAFPIPINDTSGPYWTSWTTIYTTNTYYDTSPFAKAIMSPIVNSTTMILNNVDDLVVGMQITGFPGVTIVNDVDGTPPVLLSIHPAIRQITLSVAQTIANKQQILFNTPISVSSTNSDSNPSLYPNSLDNMRLQLIDDIGQVDTTELLPRWMTSQQSNGSVLGYVPCWVLCYTKPGMSTSVLGTIDPVTGLYTAGSINRYLADTDMTLNQISFTVDRIEVDRSLTYTWGELSFDSWPTTGPSASVNNDSRDIFVNFPKKTILR